MTHKSNDYHDGRAILLALGLGFTTAGILLIWLMVRL